MFSFTGLLLASVCAQEELFFGHCVVRFAVVGPNAGAAPDKLTDKAIGNRPFRNPFREINDSLPKTSSPLLKIEDTVRLLSDNRRVIAAPESILVDPRLAAFVIRH